MCQIFILPRYCSQHMYNIPPPFVRFLKGFQYKEIFMGQCDFSLEGFQLSEDGRMTINYSCVIGFLQVEK